MFLNWLWDWLDAEIVGVWADTGTADWRGKADGISVFDEHFYAGDGAGDLAGNNDNRGNDERHYDNDDGAGFGLWRGNARIGKRAGKFT